MINVVIEKDLSGKIRSFTMDGHADFAEYGQDIVCAGASAVSFGAINSIMVLTNVEPEIEQKGGGGFLRCVIPETTTGKEMEKVQLLLEAMVVSLQTIEQQYGDFIKISFETVGGGKNA
jgi:uncharacterized protein YsxB (DUF464 family)